MALFSKKKEEAILEEDFESRFTLEKKPKLPFLPSIETHEEINVRYPLIPPYAFTHIYWDNKVKELVYDVEEPKLNEVEHEILRLVQLALEEMINISYIKVKQHRLVLTYLERNFQSILAELGAKVSEETYKKLMYYIYRDSVGLNNIEPLMNDYFIEDIECNGSNFPVFIVHRIYGNMRTNLIFDKKEELANFVEKLAQRTGRYISYAKPLLDGTLPDGSRINATYTDDVTTRGPTFCFKDGYIQLANGELHNIKDLFEDSKRRFGSKIEEGNEIVHVSNINCIGVNGKDLSQTQSRIKTIIKVKPPEKLIKIEFEDGGCVEVTQDHLFHVASDSLTTLEAASLKAGMFVPMPKEIEAKGYRQKIDVYSIIKDFSYSKNVCLIANNEIKTLVKAEILASQGSSYRSELAAKFDVDPTYFYEILSRGNSVSFKVLDQLCDSQNFSFENIQNISLNVYGGGTKGKSKAIKVPKELDEDLAYLAGALISDGNLSNSQINFSCYEEGFKSEVKKLLLEKFGKFDSYYEDTRVYLCNVFAPYFFNKVFSIPIGKKSYVVEVPRAIMKSDDTVIARFIRGLFDGDGTASGGLSYKTYSEKLAEQLTYILARIGIYSYIRKTDKEFRINIPSPYYKKFLNIVGFSSITKRTKLESLISKQVSFKTEIRHNRVPSEVFLSVMEKLGLSKQQASIKTGVSYNRFYYDTLSISLAKKLLQIFESDNKVHVVKRELDYIRWLIDSSQEFVRIKSVTAENNVDPVYDIELEPCTFYIAGNKPMNMFDTVRKFTKDPWTPIHLMDHGTASAEAYAFLWIAIENKFNMMAVGETASGKTTFLNSILFFIPPEARITSIEDTRELNLYHDNWLPAVTRSGFGIPNIVGEQYGEITLFDLLKESFRQNPDYVVLGETRGKETSVLFQGMASGHPSYATFHAGSVETLVRRLSTPPINLPPTLIESLDIICVVTHVKDPRQNIRRLKEVKEILQVKNDNSVKSNAVVEFVPTTDRQVYRTGSNIVKRISERLGTTTKIVEEEISVRSELLKKMLEQKIFDYKKVAEIINSYYKEKEKVLQEFSIKQRGFTTKILKSKAAPRKAQVQEHSAEVQDSENKQGLSTIEVKAEKLDDQATNNFETENSTKAYTPVKVKAKKAGKAKVKSKRGSK